MEMQFTFDEMTTSLVIPFYFSSEEVKEMDVDLLSVSVEGTGRHFEDSDIEVIACYRHVDDGFPEFPWNDLADLWPEEFQPTNVELGTGPNALGQEDKCPISQCSYLTPLVDTPLSPSLSEQGPNHGRYDYTGGISVQFEVNCGELNAAIYGECIVCGRSYDKFVRRQY